VKVTNEHRRLDSPTKVPRECCINHRSRETKNDPDRDTVAAASATAAAAPTSQQQHTLKQAVQNADVERFEILEDHNETITVRAQARVDSVVFKISGGWRFDDERVCGGALCGGGAARLPRGEPASERKERRRIQLIAR
jgi:hypothetical protein